jgi:hypothetical protein
MSNANVSLKDEANIAKAVIKDFYDDCPAFSYGMGAYKEAGRGSC